MERIIRTVQGDIQPGDLGFCDCHCHPLVISEHLLEHDASFFDVRDYEIAKKELLGFADSGGRSIVDAQPIGTGRASAEIVCLSKDTGLHVVASTGFHMKAFYPKGHWTFTASEQELTDIYVSEIEKGMYIGTEEAYPANRIEAKAGLIKNATEEADFDEIDQRRLRAVAAANIQTGAPLLCHTNRSALPHIPFLLNCGVDPKSILVAHLDKSNLPPEEYHLRIAELGVYLEFDSIVNAKRNTNEYEVALIKTILENGYGNQLMLGSDPVRPSFPSYDKGGQGLSYILDVFLDKLRAAGVTDSEIQNMTVDVPKEALSFIPKH